jgi:hypothetical protein
MNQIQRNLELLEKHLDLLPPEKQSVARWLCEEWRGGESKLPRQLRQRIWRHFAYDLSAPDSPAWLARELSLQLLAGNKVAIARRIRVGASRRLPLGPRRGDESHGS